MKLIEFTVFATPTPQGSLKGFVMQGKNGGKPRAILTSDNKKLKPFRQAVSEMAMVEVATIGFRPLVGKHVPVRLELDFYFAKPDSVPKKRLFPVVKPDCDKIIRSTCDALTNILFYDDAQIVSLRAEKFYGTPERVEIRMFDMEEKAVKPVEETDLPLIWQNP